MQGTFSSKLETDTLGDMTSLFKIKCRFRQKNFCPNFGIIGSRSSREIRKTLKFEAAITPNFINLCLTVPECFCKNALTTPA